MGLVSSSHHIKMERSGTVPKGVACLQITSKHLFQRVAKAWARRVCLGAECLSLKGAWVTSEVSSERRNREIAQCASAYYYITVECNHYLAEDIKLWAWVRYRLTAVCRALRWNNPVQPVGEEPCLLPAKTRGARGWEPTFLAALEERRIRLEGSSGSSSRDPYSSSSDLITEWHRRLARAVILAAREKQVGDLHWRRLRELFEAWWQVGHVISSDPANAGLWLGSDVESEGPPSLVSDDYSEIGEGGVSSPSVSSSSDIE